MQFIKQNAIALTALVFAMTGTGIAASHYLITSTAQIKPSVLRALRGSHVITRVRTVGPLSTGQRWQSARLTGSTWLQHPEELNVLYGEYTISLPGLASCAPEAGQESPSVTVRQYFAPGEQRTVTTPIEAHPRLLEHLDTPVALFEPQKATVHVATLSASDDCTGEHATIESFSLDVIGMR